MPGGLLSSTDPTHTAYPACMYIKEPHPPADTFDGFDFYACWDARGRAAGMATGSDHTRRMGQ